MIQFYTPELSLIIFCLTLYLLIFTCGLFFKVEEEYWEGEFIEACFEEMLQEEEEREMIFFSSSYPDHPHSTMDSPNKVCKKKKNSALWVFYTPAP